MKLFKYALLVVSFGIISCSTSDKTNQTYTKNIFENWKFRKIGTEEWMLADIPGSVHTDLLKNGKIEDPFFRLNEHKQQWIDKEDWEYKTVFSVEKELFNKSNIELSFEGLDTYADVFLNDSLILSADNMFRQWKVDCKSLIKTEENELRILFKSPIKIGIEKYDNNPDSIPVSGNDFAEIGKVEGNKKVSIYTRKAGYHFGWDWGPRFVTSGIWRPVNIIGWNETLIRDVEIQQNSLNEDLAKLTANIEVEANSKLETSLEIRVNNTLLKTETISLNQGLNTISSDFEIENPKMWWPNGLGEQILYNIKVKIGKDIFSEQQKRIGLRTVEVIQEKDTAGASFYFKVNGVPVFMKGANYIPQDIFLNRVTKERYESLIQSAVDANMNMLRVWGGGIYENDLFYDLCDEKGILVWQDFMFACAMFPGDDAFLKNVEREAIDNVKRLRNHPSIALWCGNNECLSAWKRWGWENSITEKQGKEAADRIWKAYKDIFLRILPDVVKKYDKDRFYWASSASSDLEEAEEFNKGDMHYWGVWHQKHKFEDFNKHVGRFMSEYGFQSFPEFKTVKYYTIPEDWDIESEVMASHQRSGIGNLRIKEYMGWYYKTPKDFQSFLYVGQVLQAEGIKMAIEVHRRNMPYCMGTLYWQLNDCWPVASWSGMDYYGNWKAMHYTTKKAFEEILVSPVIQNETLKVFVVSDKLKEKEGELELNVIDFSGNNIWTEKQTISLEPNTSKVYYEILISELPSNVVSDSTVLVADFETQSNLLYFVSPKTMALSKPNIETNISKDGDNYKIELQSDKLAKNVYLSIDEVNGFFTDNYFDLLPGKSVTIEFITKEKIDDVLTKLKVVSLVDSHTDKTF